MFERMQVFKRVAVTAAALLAAAAIAVPAASAKPVKPGPAATEAAPVASEPWEGIAVAAGLGAVVLAGGAAFAVHRRRRSPRVRAAIVEG